jgi:hypothetical protein
VTADPRASDPWRSVKDTKLIGKRKAHETSSESVSDSSGGDWKKKQKSKKP